MRIWCCFLFGNFASTPAARVRVRVRVSGTIAYGCPSPVDPTSMDLVIAGLLFVEELVLDADVAAQEVPPDGRAPVSELELEFHTGKLPPIYVWVSHVR